MQGAASPGTCDFSTLNSRVDSIDVECCDEPGEDCSGGKLSTCNEDCAAVLVPLWHDCEAELADDAELVWEAVGMCPTAVSSTVTKFMVTCPPGEIFDHCILNCDVSTAGDVLLLTHNGNDVRLLCQLANFLYSWIGAAGLGGFLGENVAAFVSAVISGVSGTYVLTLMRDADVSTDLRVEPEQNLIISSGSLWTEAPSWGAGSFMIEDRGSLTLSNTTVQGAISVGGGGNLLLDSVMLSGTLTATNGIVSIANTDVTHYD
jgi:hypothetical protein